VHAKAWPSLCLFSGTLQTTVSRANAVFDSRLGSSYDYSYSYYHRNRHTHVPTHEILMNDIPPLQGHYLAHRLHHSEVQHFHTATEGVV